LDDRRRSRAHRRVADRVAALRAHWRRDVNSLLLAVEVISLDSMSIDRITKREYYMNVGVPDYLIVDIDARIVERWTQERDTPVVLRDRLAG
jgi:Uma2 family endonuclease